MALEAPVKQEKTNVLKLLQENRALLAVPKSQVFAKF